MQSSQSEYNLMHLNDELNRVIALLATDQSNANYIEEFNKILELAFAKEYTATARHIYITEEYLKALLQYGDSQNITRFVQYKLGLPKNMLFTPTEALIDSLTIGSVITEDTLYPGIMLTELLYHEDDKGVVHLNSARKYMQAICDGSHGTELKNGYMMGYAQTIGIAEGLIEQVIMDDVELILAHITEKHHIIEGFPFLAIAVLAEEKGSQRYSADKLKDLLKHDFSKSRYPIKQDYIDAIKIFALKTLITQDPSYIAHMTDQEVKSLCALKKEEFMKVVGDAYNNCKSIGDKLAIMRNDSIRTTYLEHAGFFKIIDLIKEPIDKAIYILSELVKNDIPEIMKSALREYYEFELRLSLPKLTVPKFLRNAVEKIPSIVEGIINIDVVNINVFHEKYNIENIMAFPIEQLEKLYNAFVSTVSEVDFKSWVGEKVAILASFAQDVKNFDHATAQERIGNTVSQLFTSSVKSVYETVSNMQNIMEIKSMGQSNLDSQGSVPSR